MSLSRKYLEGMGLTEEQVSAIVEEHSSTTKVLKAKLDDAEERAEKAEKLQKENEKLQKALEGKDDNEWKEKFDNEHKAFEEFKKNIESEKAEAKVKEAYTELLKENKVGESHIKSILGVTDFKGMKLGEDGKFENLEELQKNIKDKWSGFITSSETKGAGAEEPPKGGKTYSSREEIMKISNRAERLQAIADNHELFGR
jgi:hypothetical protein